MVHSLQLEYMDDDQSINVSELRGNAKKGRKGGGEGKKKHAKNKHNYAIKPRI